MAKHNLEQLSRTLLSLNMNLVQAIIVL